MTDNELIEAVAVEVMGWHKSGSWMLDKDDRLACYHFQPITNFNHSWKVVEKVCSGIFDGYEIDYSLGWWSVAFRISGNLSLKPVSSDKSLGHAICLAALEAKRASDK